MKKVRLNISKITPGMKLAEPITTPTGITLMPAGIRLTPMFIVRIKKWNVEELDVFVDQGADAAQDSEQESGGGGTGAAQTQGQTAGGQKPPVAAQGKGKSRPGPEKRKLSAEEEEFTRATAAEISRPFINVRENQIMMQLRVAVIKRLVMHGRNGIVNVIRRESRQSEDTESA